MQLVNPGVVGLVGYLRDVYGRLQRLDLTEKELPFALPAGPVIQ